MTKAVILDLVTRYMILTRTPMRIPLGGGGTDLPGFYEKYGSFFISAAIDYYIYLLVKRRPINGIRLAYSQIEEVEKVKDIQHKIIKSSLQYLKTDVSRGLEIVSVGDLPSGAGMGSSGTFTVGLLNALHHLAKNAAPADILAQEACHINMDILKASSGKQDEYIAAYGGLMCFEISKQGKIHAYPLKIDFQTISELQNNLLMFYTGINRSSEMVLARQKEGTVRKDSKMIANLQRIQEIGYQSKEALEKGDLTKYGKLLHKHWMIKRDREAVSNSQIDTWYDIAIKNGALGGKIMGAGGGGFFAFYCESGKEKLRKAMKREGLEEVRYHFDFEGTKLITNI